MNNLDLLKLTADSFVINCNYKTASRYMDKYIESILPLFVDNVDHYTDHHKVYLHNGTCFVIDYDDLLSDDDIELNFEIFLNLKRQFLN